jgi:signal transduction histidine kinase
MKLSTRLSIVVGIIVSLLSLSIGSFAILYSQANEIKSVKSMLNASTRETIDSPEDEFVVALAVSESSPLPLSAALLTSAPDLSYLIENSASIHNKPSLDNIKAALKTPVVVENSYLIRSIQTGSNQYLIYSMSIKAAQDHSKALLNNLIIFVLLAVIISLLITYLIFKRDSKVNELAKSLQRNNERMQEFLGDASHELRTPLTVIKGYAELMSQNPTGTENSRYLQTMRIESDRMERLISELLLLAELGESAPHQNETINISDIVNRKIRELQDLTPERLIASEIEDISISSDPELVETLFANIFSNIYRHTPSDAKVIAKLEKEKAGIRISIEDGGPGIENLPDQAFSRFDKSRSRESGGSGLGMSIMQKIVETLGGTIHFSKSSLGGLKIEITLGK